MSLRMRVTIVVIALAGILVMAGSALAGSWTLTTSNGTYSGQCDVGSDGSLNCHADLVAGSPEGPNALVIQSGNCMLVLTPSGRANMQCK